MPAQEASGAVLGALTCGAGALDGIVAADSVGTANAAAGGETIWNEAACALRGRPQSVKLARDFARETLAAWGLADLCDDVTRVLSELVTNALTHGLPRSSQASWARPIQVRLSMRPTQVVCTVSDQGAGAPVLRAPDFPREGGRGLQVVHSCSDRWGWNPLDGDGKVIWAAFRVHG